MRILHAALLLTLAPQMLLAERLVCLGTQPGFMAVLEGTQAQFDYLGDGTYDLSPAFDPEAVFMRYTLGASAVDIPVFVEQRACPIWGAELSISIEFAVPSSQGQLPLFGCCRVVASE